MENLVRAILEGNYLSADRILKNRLDSLAARTIFEAKEEVVSEVAAPATEAGRHFRDIHGYVSHGDANLDTFKDHPMANRAPHHGYNPGEDVVVHTMANDPKRSPYEEDEFEGDEDDESHEYTDDWEDENLDLNDEDDMDHYVDPDFDDEYGVK